LVCSGKRTLAFCIDVEHAEKVAYAFQRYGVPSACVTGETPLKERRKMYDDLRDGKILVLTSVNVISIGFDEPAVEVGLMLRPTQSIALHLQQLGRIMRISPETGKTCGVILDQAGNTTRLPRPESITEYVLPYSKEKGTRPAPTKECPQCGHVHYTFATACACGHRWITQASINDNGMIEIDAGTSYPVEVLEKDFQWLKSDAFKKNLSPEVAEKKFAAEYGVSPLPIWYRGAALGNERFLEEQYCSYLAHHAKEMGKGIEWAIEQFSLERYGVAA